MPPFFYAVRGGPTPGVYASWDEACKHGAQGVHGVQQKKFASRAEADAFVRNSPMPAAAPVPASAQVTRPRPAQAAAAASSSSAATSSRGAAGIVAGELACFTDGACKGNNHVALNVCPAGWGVAVVEDAEGDGASGAGRLIVELFGPVCLDSGSPHFLGAEVGSNNTGELSAVCEALHWLAHVERSGRSAVICYDSEYAANQTLGQQKTNKNKALVARAQALLASARARRAVRFLHVKGHSGHRWNDAADALANRGAAGFCCDVGRWAGGAATTATTAAAAAVAAPAAVAVPPPGAAAPAAYSSLPLFTPGATLLPDGPASKRARHRLGEAAVHASAMVAGARCPACGSASAATTGAAPPSIGISGLCAACQDALEP